MTPRVQERFARAKERHGSFWQRRQWWGEALRASAGRPAAVRLALALENLLRQLPVEIQAGELIVGLHPESEPPATPPAWMSLMPSQEPRRRPEERAALSAGVFTSGHKTGHLTPNFRRLLASGFDGVLQQIEAPRPEATAAQRCEREAMAIAVRAASHLSERYAECARGLAAGEADPTRRAELETVAVVCQHVAHGPARGLQEALQLTWFAYLIECMEEGESTAAFALGRFDQYLWPYWQADRAAGLSRDAAAELVACFWVKLNEFSGLQVLNLTLGGTASAGGSGTETPVRSSAFTRSEAVASAPGRAAAGGGDAVNELSFVCLELMDEFRSFIPSLSVRWHAGLDPRFFRRATALATRGFGQPAFYGDPAVIQAMTAAGVAARDAVDVVPGGCVELGVEGCCHPWVGNFFNLPKCLELALHDGVEPRTGERLGPATGRLAALGTFAALCAAYERQVAYFLELMAGSDNTTDALAGEYSPFPFLSALVDDCSERGLDITQGGARYNFTEVQGIGLAHVVDSLLNLRHLVYETAEIGLEDIVAKVDADFQGDDSLRRRLQSLRPAYGHGDPAAQELVRRVAHGFFTAVERSSNPRGGPHRAGLLVWTLYHEWADCVGPLPDGRRRGQALVSSSGPRAEVVIDSPTSVRHDGTAFDHWRCTGALTLNLRFSHAAVANDNGLAALEALLRVYFEKGGMQVQINVADSALLRAAQANPAAHADLVVRVSGFAARFVTLSARMQDEIIARTELRTGT
jgi:formate C-acetyltransferase